MIKVAFIDDDRLVRLGIRNSLSDCRDVMIVGEAENGLSALSMIRTCSPDIVLLDFNLPDISGIEVSQRIHTCFPHIKIIFLTSSQHIPTLARLLNTSAAALITKDSIVSEVDIIKAVYLGKSYLQANLGMEIINYLRQKNNLQQLTNREYEVLRLSTQSYTQEEIAERLSIGQKSVGTIKLRAMKKIHVKNRKDLIAIFTSY